MRLYVNGEVEVAVRAAINPRLTLACQADLGAGVHAGRDGNGFFAAAALDTVSITGMAGGFNGLAGTIASRAGGHLDHGTQNGLTSLTHLTAPTTGSTAHRRGARLCARTIANFTNFVPGKL